MGAPVALFVYNRLKHTSQVLEALDQNDDADKTELYIFSDASADETEAENVMLVRKLITDYSQHNSFYKTHLVLAEKNKGLSKSLIEGITEMINRYGRIIVLEDDHVTSRDFIRFMNAALDYYEADRRVWSISGFTPDLKVLHHYHKDVYCGCRGYCWGWGTWKNRFELVDWKVSDYDAFMRDKKAQREFNRGGMDMTPLLMMQHNGTVNSWAIRWCYQEYKEHMLTIFPSHSKVKNIGFDGSGTNSGNGNVFHAVLKEDRDWDFRYDAKDNHVFRELRNYHSKLYMRQILGKYWYDLTEYEYCVIYRKITENEYHVLKPNFREWYADPIPYEYNGKHYVFMEVFDKIKQKGHIGVSEYNENGMMKRPMTIIEEPFHMSFPNLFEYKEKIYMLPECSASEQFRIYRMEESIDEWKAYYVEDGWQNITDIAIYEIRDNSVFALASRVNKENPYQSRLVFLQIENLEDFTRLKIQILWEQAEYSYGMRNGGNIFRENGISYRAVQHSTRDIYGKFITLNRIMDIEQNVIQEKVTKKITSSDYAYLLPPFIYRTWGTHTYGKTDEIEVADIQVQRFSVGGLFNKIARRV